MKEKFGMLRKYQNNKEGSMKRIPIILTTGLLLSGLSLPAMALENMDGAVADIVEVTPNQVIEPALEFVMTNTSANKISFKFDGSKRHLKLTRLLVASYEFPKFSQGMVDKRLEELGTVAEPSWVRSLRDLTPELKPDDELQEKTVAMSDGSYFFGNDPGVFYYAAQIKTESEETYWVRGKIDYRMCAYSYNNFPHNVNTCYGKIDEESQRYVFERREGVIRDPDDRYVSWEEEWTNSISMSLVNVRNNIEEWMGDIEEKNRILSVLQNIRDTAEDAKNYEEALDKLGWYELLLRAKSYKYDADVAIWDLESRVANWEDDQDERVKITESLAKMSGELDSVNTARETLNAAGVLNDTTDRQTDVSNLLERLERCKVDFETKTAKYDEEHPTQEDDKTEKPVVPGVTNPEKPTPSVPTTPENPVNPSPSPTKPVLPDDFVDNNGSGGVDGGGLGSVADEKEETVRPDDGVEVQPNESQASGVKAPTKDNNMVAVIDLAENSQDVLESKPTDTVEDEARKDDQTADKVKVPALNEKEVGEQNNEKKGSILPVVAVVMAIAAGLWWVKRAFWGRKKIKN